jgi:hypothetical protein
VPIDKSAAIYDLFPVCLEEVRRRFQMLGAPPFSRALAIGGC